jgi:DNA-binding NtrC family response regulator
MSSATRRINFMLSDVGHVVVVDDDPSLRQMVIRYLEDHNMPTKSASNRIELNRHFAGTSPSLIILDLRLGQDDGLDLLREIRSHSDVPVIIMTGHRPDEIDRIVGLKLGADDYIVKPFSLRELLAAFAPYCGGRKWEGLHVTMIRSEAVKDLTAGSLNRMAVDSWIPIRRRSR